MAPYWIFTGFAFYVLIGAALLVMARRLHARLLQTHRAQEALLTLLREMLVDLQTAAGPAGEVGAANAGLPPVTAEQRLAHAHSLARHVSDPRLLAEATGISIPLARTLLLLRAERAPLN